MTKRITYTVALVLAIAGCSPGGVWSDGEDGDESTGSPSIEPDDGYLCVQADPGAVTCWLPEEDGQGHILVWLDCQIKAAEVAGVFAVGKPQHLDDWGSVTCHDVQHSDAEICFMGPHNIVLIPDGGSWQPLVRDDIGGYLPEPSPC